MNATVNRLHNFTHGTAILRQQKFLTLDEAIRRCPSITATEGHERTSDKYSFISTADVLSDLIARGFQIESVQAARVKDAGRHGFEKHMIRLQDRAAQVVGDTVAQFCLSNSHDGTSGFRLDAALRVLACNNGLMIAAGNIDTISIPHRGNQTLVRVIEGTQEVFTVAQAGSQAAVEWLRLDLTDAERRTFAEEALALRYGRDEQEKDEEGVLVFDAYGKPVMKQAAPVQAERLLHPMRSVDRGNNLWKTFNVVQEHLVKGGIQGRRLPGMKRAPSVRAMTGIDALSSLNRQLFRMADTLAAKKGAPTLADLLPA